MYIYNIGVVAEIKTLLNSCIDKDDHLLICRFFIMIGIYKITSPINEIYIGQSVNIENRFKSHKNTKEFNSTRKIYISLHKYGSYSHKFEIIEECDIDKLNERERYWQEFYNKTHILLNVKLTNLNDKSGYLTERHKQLLRKPKVQLSKKYAFFVLDTKIGVYYNTISEASKSSRYSDHKIRRMLLGIIKNTTNLVIV